jgi:hypothetical protein
MQSPELVAQTRLEDLLAGAFPDTEHEARLQGVVRELRGSQVTTPASLRERVAALRPAPSRFRRFASSRVATSFAALLVLVAAVAGAVAFLPSGGSDESGSAESASALRPGDRVGSEQLVPKLPPDYGPAPVLRGSLVPLGSPSSTGAQDVDMWIDLRVAGADGVSSGAREAMRITRELGGLVVSSSVVTRAGKGEANLSLKIPTAHLEDAVFRLSQLGTVVGQQVETEDLEVRLGREARRIAHLRSEIRIERARLASGQLDAAEELRVRIRLERLRTRLAGATRHHAATQRRAAMADLTVRFATAPAAPVEKSEGGVGGALDKAVDVLRGAGSVAVFLAVVLSPVLLLVVLAWLALRARSRRIEHRLLTESRPGPPTQESSG